MAEINYFTDPRGYPGTLVTGSDPGGTTRRYVIPAVQIVGQDKNPAPFTVAGPQTSSSSQSITPASDATSNPNNSITPVVGAGVSSLLVKSSPGNFYGATVTNNTTAGYLIAYNANAVPASGAALTAANILGVKTVAASVDGSVDPQTVPDRFSAGIVILFSTSTTTYTVPGTLPLFMKGRGA